MLRLVSRAITIIALCLAVGLQWIALQSVAWASMIVRSAKQTSFSVAVKQTFDGAHPCSLCHTVNKGKAADQKRDARTTVTKVDIACVSRVIRLLPRSVPFEYAASSVRFSEAEHSPPVPPPRASLG